ISCPWRAFVGGPVEKSAVFLLHSFADLADGADPIVPGVWLGQERELFAALIDRVTSANASASSSGSSVPAPFRVFCGYAGWGEGQLDSELETGSWLIQPASAELILAPETDDLWQKALEGQGGAYSLFARMPENPELN